jgi:hypothetical protein
MSESQSFTPEQIVEMCQAFTQAQTQLRLEPAADHEGWNSRLELTPRMVQHILDANNEI